MNAALASPNLTFTTPPPGLVMPQAGQEITLIAFGGGAVILVIYALWLAWSRKSWLPVLFLVAGAFSIMLEPIADIMGNVIHSPVGQIFAFQAKGMPVPWHVVIGYVWYYGALNIILFDRFRARTMTPRLWWWVAVVSMVAVTAVEQIPIYYGIWVYYGQHGAFLGVMPLSMAAANAASVMVSSLLVYRLMPILKGWKQLLVLALVPCVVVGSHTGASIPSYIALGQDTATVAPWILWAGSLLTAGFSVMLIWLGISLVHNRIPEVETFTVDDRVTHGAAPSQRATVAGGA